MSTSMQAPTLIKQVLFGLLGLESFFVMLIHLNKIIIALLAKQIIVYYNNSINKLFIGIGSNPMFSVYFKTLLRENWLIDNILSGILYSIICLIITNIYNQFLVGGIYMQNTILTSVSFLCCGELV